MSVKPFDYLLLAMSLWFLWLGIGAIIHTNETLIRLHPEKFWAIVGRRFLISVGLAGILLWRLYG